MKVLFISPHPDDTEIACGGTVARMVEQGNECDIAVVTGEGDLTMVHSGQKIPFHRRVAEQDHAAAVMGVRQVHYLGIAPASKFDTVSVSVLVGKLDALLANKAYDYMYVPLPSHNQDHNYVWQACMAATRPTKVDHMCVFAYEQPTQSHGEQLCNQLQGRSYVKLEQKHIDIKLAALSKHQSQMNVRENSLVGAEGVEVLARMRGLEIGAKYAELFYMLRSVV